MKAIIKTIGTILSISLIVIGLTALFTIDNAQGLTGLITYAAIMIISISGGIYLLTLMYPELLDISEFDDKSLKALEDCQVELDILREHNILLLDRYITFKSVLKSHKSADYSDITSYPKLYHLIYVEDLTVTEEETNSILKEYEKEIKELREENLLLIDRYMTFKSIIRSSNAIDESDKIKYPNLYYIFYEEDLAKERTKL